VEGEGEENICKARLRRVRTAFEGMPSTRMSRLSFLIEFSMSAAVRVLEDLCELRILLNECAADELAEEDEEGGMTETQRSNQVQKL
jgi:hypothetical protein